MRNGNWKVVLVAVLFSAGTTAYLVRPADAGGGGGKGGGSGGGSAAGSDEGEIEMGDDDAGSGSDEPEIEMGDDQGSGQPSLEGDINAANQDQDAVVASQLKAATKPVSWSDIVTVIRKPFLKLHRTELLPMFGTTMNDNMIRHYSFGAEINYYLTDVLSVGVEGQYYIKNFREPFDLVARQARRLPTVNKYNFSAALNFHYVPVYGKFAVLNKRIVTWEVAFTAGIGATQSEVIPRDTRFPGFKNILITPNVGAGFRFFLFKWLTVSLGVRDYVFIDKFEPTNREIGMNETAADAKAHADSALINNVMFQIGVAFWIPPSFDYTTFR
jgi:outer membrane beta-barrel protein